MKPYIDYQRTEASRGSGSRTAGRRVFATILALALAGMTGSAYGASCTVSSSGVSFGVYDPISSGDNDSIGNINVSCSGITLLLTYHILLSTGGGSYAQRSMSDGANHSLGYNLYTNSGRTTIWGDGTGGTGTVSDIFALGIGTAARDHTVYGRIPAQQNAYVGSYTDTIAVTVNY